MKAQHISLISTFINLTLAILKLVVGLINSSIALIAEGLHSGLDVISSFISYLGIKTSEKPADKSHPYGYEKYEGIASFVIVILLFISGIWIFFETGKTLFLKETSAQFSLWGIILMVISLIVNEIMARLKFRFGEQFSSLALIADAEHSRADVISSLGVIIGLFLIKFFPLADTILAVLVGFYIFFEAYNLSKEAIASLVDIANPQLEQEISHFLKTKGLVFEEIKTRKIGNNNFAEISLIFDPHLKIEEITSFIKNLEKELINQFPSLKQVSLLIKSHEIKERIIKPRFGPKMCFGNINIKPVGPKKDPETKRIVIPWRKDKIFQSFGSEFYLILDINKEGKIIRQEIIKNPYFEPGGPARGTRFIKSIQGDEVWLKRIGENAKNNLLAQGIKVKIIQKDLTLNNLKNYAQTKIVSSNKV